MVRNRSIKSMLEDCDQDTYDRIIHKAKLSSPGAESGRDLYRRQSCD